MAVELTQDVDGCTLRLTGVVDIFEAQALHGAAMTAHAAGTAVILSAASLAALDTSTTQILLALKRALAAGGRTLRVDGAPEGVLEAWRGLGLGDELP